MLSDVLVTRSYNRKISNIIFLLLFGVVFFPGLLVIRNIRFEILGFPFALLWLSVIGPGIFLIYYLADLYLDIRNQNSAQGVENDGV